MVEDIVVGGLYATKDDDGLYRIVKVLVVDEYAVHLRSYATRFKELPVQVISSELSMGGLGRPEGFGVGHFPIAQEGFYKQQRVLVGQEMVEDRELEGYRIWAGIDTIEE